MRGEAFAQRDRDARRGDAAPAQATVSAVNPSTWIFLRRRSGDRVTLETMDVEQLWPRFDLKSLYRLSWGGAIRRAKRLRSDRRDEFEPRLLRYQHDAMQGAAARPESGVRVFPRRRRRRRRDRLRPARPGREIARFPFARQAGGDHLSLADYLREPHDGALPTSWRYRW